MADTPPSSTPEIADTPPETAGVTTVASDAPQTPAPRPVHHGWWFWTRAVLLVLAIPLIFVVLAAFLIVGQEITAPTWIKSRIETQASEALAGGAIRMDEITITIARDLHPSVTLRGVSVQDANGQRLARVQTVRAGVSPRGLLFQGDILPQTVSLDGAELALTRDADGAVALAFETGAAPAQTASNLPELLDGLDAMFDAPALAALEEVRATGLILNYADQRARRTWTVDGGRAVLTVDDQSLSLGSSVALLSGRSYVTTLAATYASRRGTSAAELGLNITDAVAADIASQSPALSFLTLIDAQLSGAMRASIDDAGTLGPINATLEMGQGALRPTAQTAPIGFDALKIYLGYDPAETVLRFDQIEVASDWGNVIAEGHAYLRELRDDIPQALLGQFNLTNISLNPNDVYPRPIEIEQALADIRLRLDPFQIDLGQVVISDPAGSLYLDGHIGADAEGWTVALDGTLPAISKNRVLDLWPTAVIPKTRSWLANNLLAGELFNVNAGLRLAQGDKPVYSVGFEFRDTDARVMPTLPVLTRASGVFNIAQDAMVIAVSDGHFTAPQGGRIDAAGSVFSIPTLGIPEPPARIDLVLDSTVTAALSVLDLKPFEFLSKASLPVTLADGRARTRGTVTLPLRKTNGPGDIRYSFDSAVRNVTTSRLIPDRTLTADQLAVSVDNDALSIGGDLALDGVPVSGTWTQRIGAQYAGRSQVKGTVELSETFVQRFNLGLPRGMVSGRGTAAVTLDLQSGQDTAFELSSNLRGVGLSLPALNWSKGRSGTGNLSVTGTLGPVPRITDLAVEAAGLEARGNIRLNADRSFERAEFSRVRLGGWLNAPVTLTGRGAGRPVGISIGGGSLDLRRAEFGGGGGETGPMSVRLNDLQITSGIALTDFRAELTGAGGLSGRFQGAVNGQQQVTGTLVPQNGGTAVRIRSDNAGGVLRAAGFLPGARKGEMDLILVPTGAEGTYDGQLDITDIRLRDAPTMAALLDAISIVGLLQQLDGNGLLFSEVDAKFRLDPRQIIITESSAVGPSIGLSLDGRYALAEKRMDFQGVASPLYLLNGIGSVLTRRGEGLIGFNFNLRGTPAAPDVAVNPLSVFTPGMFREIFRRPPPQVSQ